MALFFSASISPIPPVRSQRQFAISELLVSGTLTSTKPISNSKFSISTSSLSSNFSNQTLPRSHCRVSSSSTMEPSTSPSATIFIKGLAQSTSEESLKTACSQFGEVSRVKIIKEKRTRQSLGFAYVWFISEESAHTAVNEMNVF
ncbi:organelle RRM domain-containing protein 2, mitochondrial isoform X2 [Cornus florida]|uniref:organelle RRM domain-containing protein 2, mitochondrial isoform X2 n=1 Tax=Cornus florida TaxID=4283 RepID=UPI002899CA79|nr:organelle RRM domain-containing protein 2, mitochondrial isoform X2 [Cornus florida]